MRATTDRNSYGRRSSGALVIFCVGLFVGCVPRDAGYADVRNLLASRGVSAPRSTRGELSECSKACQALLRRPLSAEGAARVALLNHPDAAAAMASVGILRGELVASAALPNPHAEVGMKFGHEAPSIDLAVMQNVTELVLYSAKRKAADANLRAAAAEAADALLLLGYRAKAEFYRTQALEQKLALQREVLQVAYAAYDAAQRYRAAGNITELQLARQQAAYETVRFGLAQLEAEALQQRIRLNSALGLFHDPAKLQLEALSEPDLNEPSLVSDATLAALRDNNLALLALEEQLRGATGELDYQLTKGWLPELKAGVSAEREANEWAAGPGIELELPLFDQGQGKVSASKARLLQLKARVESAATHLHNVSAAVQTRRADARARLEYTRRTLVPLHERLVHEAQLQYNAMSIGAIELFSAKQAELFVKLQRVDMELEYWLVENDWQLLRLGALPPTEFARGDQRRSRALSRWAQPVPTSRTVRPRRRALPQASSCPTSALC